jgi:PEP-CTERM motif
MMKTALVGSAALAAVLALGVSTSASAFGIERVVEDATLGFVGAIPTSAPPIIVGSDGEAAFDPFGAGFDTTDGIVLNADWAPDPAFAAAFGPGLWTELPGTNTWVLPACIDGVCENGFVKEPIAKWDFLPGGQWGRGTLSIAMFDPDGTFSDFVGVANDGPNGGATITFSSGVPEPAAWTMMLIGFAGIGYAARRRTAAAAI